MTSTEVKNRYNRKAYDQLNIRISKGKLEQVSNLAENVGLSVAELVRQGIDRIASENGYNTLFGGGGSRSSKKNMVTLSQALGRSAVRRFGSLPSLFPRGLVARPMRRAPSKVGLVPRPKIRNSLTYYIKADIIVLVLFLILHTATSMFL